MTPEQLAESPDRVAKTVVPVRLSDTRGMAPHWYKSLVWPLPFDRVNAIVKGTLDRYVDAVLAIDDEDERMVALLTRRFMAVHALVQYAHFVEAADETLTFTGPGEIEVLAGRLDPADFRASGTELGLPSKDIRFRAARRALRTATWTPLARLPRALLRPAAIAVNHNSLLRDYLSRGCMTARLAYAEDYIAPRDPADPGLLKKVDATAVGRYLARKLASAPELTAEMRSRLEALFTPFMEEAARDSLGVLARLRMRKRLPRRLLSGTGGRFESRAIALEIIRRGGSVVRFGHAGAYPLMNSSSFIVQQELAVSSSLILCTPEAAAMPNITAARERIASLRDVPVVGHTGDPGLVPKHLSPGRVRAGRLRVMYVATAYFGFNQLFPPAMPEPLYLAWQMRLIGQLKALDVDVLCKPHPEGIRPADPYPLETAATVSHERFEDISHLVDVLVFDHPATTSLAVAMSTEQPIVLIDLGNMDFNPVAEHLVRHRCRLLRARYDSRNQPTVDRDELADAVLSKAPVDPTPFRRLYLGERQLQ